MKRNNLFQTLVSPDVFKAVFFIVSIVSVCPLVVNGMTPFLKLFHVYGLFAIVYDLLTERRLLHNQGRVTLALFVLCYLVTLISNPNLLGFSGLSNFGYLFITLCLVYSYGKESDRRNRISSRIVCALISVANIVGIWMFFTKYNVYTTGGSFIGIYIYENRLCGLFGNPAVLSMVSLVGFYMSIIQFSKATTRKYRVLSAIEASINFITLLLGNARSGILSVVCMCAITTFLMLIKHERSYKRVFTAVIAAVMVAIIALSGVKIMQRTLALLDVKYDYYYNHICWENPDNLPSNNMDQEDEDKRKEEELLEEELLQEEALNSGLSSKIERDDSGLNGRWELWMTGLKMLPEKPIFGFGLDNHNYSLEQMGEAHLPVKGNLHNTYLDILVCCGVAGFICLLIYLVIMLRNVIAFFKYNDGTTWNQGVVLFASIAGLMVLGLADSTLIASVYPTAIGFWYIASQFAGLLETENKKTGHYKKDVLGIMIDKILRKRD